MVLFQKWCEASALWTNHFSCLAGSWKSRSEAYIYITGILPHKDHSWNVEWGNCSGLVYATPILTHILLLFLSCTSGILTVILRHPSSWSSVCGPVPTSLCVFLMWQCTKGSCQSPEEVIFRQSGMVAEVSGSSGTAAAELSSTLSPASWGLSSGDFGFYWAFLLASVLLVSHLSLVPKNPRVPVSFSKVFCGSFCA